jgi:hypothetical protein
MQTILGWALVIGILFSIIGAGGAFVQLGGSILAIALVMGGMRIILGINRLGEVLLPVLGIALALVLVPSLIAGLLQNIWHSFSRPALFLIGLAILLIALIVSREKR